MSNEKIGSAVTASRALEPTETNPLDFVPDKIPFDTLYGPPISLDRAQAVIHAAVAEAKRRNWKMNVAVVDSGGNLVAFQRMDGAMLASIQIAEHEARAAATFRRETKFFEDGIQPMHLNYLLAFDGIIASRGGIPLIEQGVIHRRTRLFGRNGFPGRNRQRGRRGSNQPTAGKEQMIQISRKRWGQSTGFRDKQIDRRMP
jgi:glc operon protein GlcG